MRPFGTKEEEEKRKKEEQREGKLKIMMMVVITKKEETRKPRGLKSRESKSVIKRQSTWAATRPPRGRDTTTCRPRRGGGGQVGQSRRRGQCGWAGPHRSLLNTYSDSWLLRLIYDSSPDPPEPVSLQAAAPHAEARRGDSLICPSLPGHYASLHLEVLTIWLNEEVEEVEEVVMCDGEKVTERA
ncbi:hypothetical protein E2C01_057881 [Portunus trituberculatus]|uniref:Uncharacterized protein n=1 Tax=Portunus trituberculatus TaxID=210409 RepID=A0A5B7H3U5_PORTR|nr:hypothetical protein [Portunus trituberculatus]